MRLVAKRQMSDIIRRWWTDPNIAEVDSKNHQRKRYERSGTGEEKMSVRSRKSAAR